MKNYLVVLFILLGYKLTHAQTLQVTLTVLNNPCTNNGQVQINVTGGVAPYTYNYGYFPFSSIVSTTLNNNIISGLPPCQMYVSVVDAAGNYGSNDIQLLGPIQTTITASPAICPALGEIQISNIGSGPFQNELYLNGSLISSTAPFTNLPPAIYSVKTTDANGCFIYTDSVYVENISGLNLSIVPSNLTCQGGTLTVNVLGGISPYAYNWSSGNSTSNVMNAPIGYYNVEVIDAQGCVETGYSSIYSPVYIQSNAVVAPTTCPNSTGSIIVFPTGGTAPYACTWNNGGVGSQISNLNDGSYIATIVDAAGCYTTEYFYVPTLSPMYSQTLITNSNCLSPTGGAQLTISGGTAPYAVQWASNPPQTGMNLQNVFTGTYAYEITDANGCVDFGSASVGNTDPIYTNVTFNQNTCGQNNGSIDLNAWGNGLTYLWNNGATTQAINNLAGGAYSCTITNVSGCTKTVGEYVSTNSPFNVVSAITNASCIYTADGQITLNITGGTPPYNISWNNGAVGTSNNNIITGDYYASISDVNGCNFSYYYHVGYISTSPCACTLTGKVYFDANNNCVFDNGEVSLSNVNVELNNGVNNSYSITDVNGDYHFFVPTGTYTLEQFPYHHFAAGSCNANPITVNANGGTNCTIINNFADTAPAINDLYTNCINLEPAVVGYGYKQRVFVKNNGTTVANSAMLNMKANNYAGLSNSTFAGNIVSGTPNWNFTNLPSLNINESFSFDLTYNVSSTTPTNTLLLYTDTAQKSSLPWLQDETPWDNVKNLQTYTVASLDPNYKEVSPKGYGANGDINFSDSLLNYTVHFENTGNYFAYNIEIVDSISSNLDLNSFEMLFGSHPYQATIDENRVLHIKFNNIMLSWGDGINTGFAAYAIKIKKNLAIGTKIKNTAYIYFDFNEAVITNTTINTLVVNAGLEKKEIGEFSLFPNPAKDILTIVNQKNTMEGTIDVYDIMGKIWLSKVITQPVNKVEVNNVDQLPNGLYFVNITTPSGDVKSLKFVKVE